MTIGILVRALFSPVGRVTPSRRFEALRAGRSVLVDVREPGEWEAGVAETSALLSLRDLIRARRQWRTFLAGVGERELVLYCGAGVRSHLACRLLKAEGYRAINGGAFREWKAAGWPIVVRNPNDGLPPKNESRRF